MTLRERIYSAINEYADSLPSYMRAQYEDDYDGFTHSTYSGLADAVTEELIDQGYNDNVPMSVIEELVFDLWI